MSLTGTILGKKQKVQFIQNPTGTVFSVDCSVQENHSRESPPSEFPVESGQTVSDNIIVKPFSLELHGIISDTPLELLNAAITTVASAVLPPVGVIAGAAGVALFSSIASSEKPSVAAFAQLLSLQEQRLPFDVLTTLYRYENMFIKSLVVPRDASTGQILTFQLNLVQLILVQPQTVNIQKFSSPDLSASEADQGKNASSAAAQFFQKGMADFGSLVQ